MINQMFYMVDVVSVIFFFKNRRNIKNRKKKTSMSLDKVIEKRGKKELCAVDG
jgi:hypothetical protein